VTFTAAFTRHLLRALERRSSPLLAALAAFVLALPTLRAGFIADDYLHRMVLLHKGAWGAAMDPVSDLFAFVCVWAVRCSEHPALGSPIRGGLLTCCTESERRLL